MMKKLSLAILIFAVIICATPVHAENVKICTDKDGIAYHILTETITNRTEFWRNRKLTVDVEISRKNAAPVVKNYSFSENDCMVFCSVDDAMPDAVYKNMPNGKIWRYCLKFLGIDYEVRCDG